MPKNHDTTLNRTIPGPTESEAHPETTPGGEVIHVLVLGLLCLVLFFFGLGDRPLWDVDEGMHAATSMDMVRSGDWVTPTLNGERFYDKPILYNWLAAIAFLIFGFTEFAARLPAALLGLGCVLVTYLIGRRALGPRAGFLGGVILATSLEFIVLSRSVVHDISLAFFVTLTLHFFYAGYTGERHRRLNMLLAYAASGFAVLAKGPVGLLIPAMIIGLFLIFEKRLRFVGKMEIGWGILIFLAVAAPWYVLISLRNPDYARYFFVEQNLARFLSDEVLHRRPVYYYLPVLLWGFFPWVCFLPAALAHPFRNGIRNVGRGSVFLLMWFGAVFIFFSAASSKLSPYVLPLYPGMSLLTAGAWLELIGRPKERRRWFLVPLTLLLVILAAGLVTVLIEPPITLRERQGILLDRMDVLLALMVFGVALTLWLLVKRSAAASFAALSGIMVCQMILLTVYLIPSTAPYRSSKGVAMTLNRIAAPDDKLAFYQRLKDSVLFYTGRTGPVFDGPEKVDAFFDTKSRAFCVLDLRYYEEIKPLLKGAHKIVQEGDTVLLSNRP